jgi:hypothetical protein
VFHQLSDEDKRNLDLLFNEAGPNSNPDFSACASCPFRARVNSMDLQGLT